MPLKIGSGGLKYPIPNRAQIQAQQNAAAASAGGSASASAYGANLRYAGLKKQLQYDAYRSALDREFRAEQAYFQRQHEAGGQLEAQRAARERQQAGFDQQTALEQSQYAQQTALQEASQQFRADQADLDRQFTKDRDDALRQERAYERGDTPEQRQFRRDQARRTEEAYQKGQVVLSPADEAALNRLEEGLTWAGKNLDQRGQAEYVKNYERDKQAILGRAKPPGPTLEEQFQQDIYTDPKSGTRFQRNKNGEWSPLEGDGQEKDGEYRKKVESVADSLKKQTDPSTGQLYTENRALAEAAKQVQARDKFFNGQPADSEPVATTPGLTTSPPAGGLHHAVPMGGGAPVQPPAPMPDAQVQSTVKDIQSDIKATPLDPKTETPELRKYYEDNMEDIVRWGLTPIDQVPEEKRGAVDFFNRQAHSLANKQPIVLRSPDEAKYLPSGTEFIDPQGNKRKVP